MYADSIAPYQPAYSHWYLHIYVYPTVYPYVYVYLYISVLRSVYFLWLMTKLMQVKIDLCKVSTHELTVFMHLGRINYYRSQSAYCTHGNQSASWCEINRTEIHIDERLSWLWCTVWDTGQSILLEKYWCMNDYHCYVIDMVYRLWQMSVDTT